MKITPSLCLIVRKTERRTNEKRKRGTKPELKPQQKPLNTERLTKKWICTIILHVKE